MRPESVLLGFVLSFLSFVFFVQSAWAHDEEAAAALAERLRQLETMQADTGRLLATHEQALRTARTVINNHRDGFQALQELIQAHHEAIVGLTEIMETEALLAEAYRRGIKVEMPPPQTLDIPTPLIDPK